jgi:hypothetical protein
LTWDWGSNGWDGRQGSQGARFDIITSTGKIETAILDMSSYIVAEKHAKICQGQAATHTFGGGRFDDNGSELHLSCRLDCLSGVQ